MDHTSSAGSGKDERSVWSFRHLALGVAAIFFYVGAEVSIGVNVNLHAMQMIESGHKLSFFGNDNISLLGLDLGIPALLATLYWGGMMAGRIIFSFFSKIPPRTLLTIMTSTAAILVATAMIADNL